MRYPMDVYSTKKSHCLHPFSPQDVQYKNNRHVRYEIYDSCLFKLALGSNDPRVPGPSRSRFSSSSSTKLGEIVPCFQYTHWLNWTPTCSVAMLVLRNSCFCGGRRKRWRCYAPRVLSSMQRKTAKEAWWPNCEAPGLVYASALFFETFMHVYVRTMYDQIYSAGKIKKNGGQVSGWTCRTRVQTSRVYRLKPAWTFGRLCGKIVFLRSCV